MVVFRESPPGQLEQQLDKWWRCPRGVKIKSCGRVWQRVNVYQVKRTSGGRKTRWVEGPGQTDRKKEVRNVLCSW